MRRAWMAAGAALGSVIVGAVGAAPASAEGHHFITVRPGQSIQAAIDRAQPGDTILVERGTYHESLLITTDDITLRSADPDDRNVILEPPAVAPNNICTQANGGASGICVIGSLDQNFNVVRNVEGVRIAGFTIEHFPQNGVFGYGTDRLEVSDVSAVDNAAYGIARFNSTRSLIHNNAATGSGEAGLYIGDSPDADTLVYGNSSWGNGFGVFVRHSHEVTVSDNNIWNNCVGVLVLDDGQPGGAGNVWVTRNFVRNNNAFCPASEEGPATSGGGIVLVGAVHSVVSDNRVSGNESNSSIASGGILLISAASIDGGSAVIDDVVRHNVLSDNAPADLVYDGSGSGDRFIDNRCASSIPSGLCR